MTQIHASKQQFLCSESYLSRMLTLLPRGYAFINTLTASGVSFPERVSGDLFLALRKRIHYSGLGTGKIVPFL